VIEKRGSSEESESVNHGMVTHVQQYDFNTEVSQKAILVLNGPPIIILNLIQS